MTIAFKKKMLNTVRYVVLIFVALFMLYPLFWMVSGIWKENSEIFTSPGLIPQNPANGWEAIRNGWTTRSPFNLGHYFLNTLRFLIPRVIAQVISCVITAYAVSRLNLRVKKIVFALIIVTLLLPDVIFRIPMFMLWRDLNLLGTFLPLWLDSAFATASFFVFMLIQFMRTIPRDLDEAAKIDGCNSFQTLTKILVPCMVPAIITVALLSFMWGMNDFLGPLIYIREVVNFPLSIALRMASDNTDGVILREVFAMSTIALIPSITLFFMAQRYFVEGIVTTGSKE